MKKRSMSSVGRYAVASAVALWVMTLAGVSSAEPPPEREWDLSLGAYGWLTASDLEVGGESLTGGSSSRNFNQDLGDAFSDWNGGGGGYVDYRFRRFVGLVDGSWVQTEGEDGLDWSTNTIVDALVGFRVLDINRPFSDPNASGPAGPRFHLDLLAGARYVDSTSDLDRDGGLDIDEYRNWFDPVVGVRFGAGLTDNLSLSTVADIGGFNLGSASNLTWSLNPRLNYRAFDHLDLFVGWRHLYVDHDGDLEFSLTGPQVGLGYSF